MGLNFALFFIAVVAAVILGMKTKVNMGIWAFMFSFILGFFRCGLSISGVVGKFPSYNFYLFIAASMFYAFGSLNGTITLFARKLVYSFRNQTWMGPFVLFIIASVISISGSNGTTGLILSGMIYAFAEAMGMNPLPCLIAVHAAAGGWGLLPWTTAGASNYGFLSASGATTEAMNASYIASIIATCILLGGTFVVMISKKSISSKEGVRSEFERPEPFTQKQKATLAIIFVAIALIVIPVVLKTFFKSDLINKISGFLSIQTVWTAGIILQALLDLGDLKEIIAKKVPWNSIILVTGMTTLFSLASALGVVNILGDFISSVPRLLVLPCIATICAILSSFVSGLVITPFFAALCATFAAASGYSLTLIMATIIAGAAASSISPVSAGGAYLLSAAPNETILSKCRAGLAKVAIVNVFVEFAVWLVIAIIAA